MSADMSPYCSAHDEWLIMKLCMYVGCHDANNVSNYLAGLGFHNKGLTLEISAPIRVCSMTPSAQYSRAPISIATR